MIKNVLIVAAFAALSACRSSEAQEDGQAAGTETPEQIAIDRATAQIAGSYEVVAEDGAVVLQTVSADGTYVETIDNAEIERGIWHQKGDQMCFDRAGATIEQCYTGGRPGSDGAFDVEMDGGTASVRRVDEGGSVDPATAEAVAQ